MRKIFLTAILVIFCGTKMSSSAPPTAKITTVRMTKAPTAKTPVLGLTAKDLARNYSLSGGFTSAQLRLGATGQYVLSSAIDVPGHGSQRSGRYFFHDNALSLGPDNFKGDKRAEQRAIDFYVVRWGQRVYLVGRYNVEMFCEDIRAGYVPSTPQKPFNAYFLRDGDDTKAVSNWPTLPPQFQHLLPITKFNSYKDWQQSKPKKQRVNVIRGLNKTVEQVK